MKNLNEKELVRDPVSTEDVELQRLLQELDEDPLLKDVTVTEEFTQKVFAKIAAIEAAKEDIETPQETEERNENIIRNINERFLDMTPEELAIYKAHLTPEQQAFDDKIIRQKKRLRAKGYLLLVAVFILMMGMGTVGMGEDFKWLSTESGEQSGTNSVISVDSDENITITENLSELEAYEYAKEIMGTPVIYLTESSGKLKFQSIDASGEQVGCILHYLFEEKIISYNIISNINSTSHKETLTGELVEEYEVLNGDNVITIQKYEEENGMITYKASFVNNNIYYSLKGVLSIEVLTEILENLYFY